MLTLPQATALGPLEHAVMRIVWAYAAPITVKQVHEALSADRAVAYTTVMTTMVRLAEKGLLTRASRTVEGRSKRGVAYHYTSAVSRAELLRTAVEQLLTRFDADEVERQHLAAAVRHGSRGVW
jgi:predicted transcriptional regulator